MSAHAGRKRVRELPSSGASSLKSFHRPANRRKLVQRDTHEDKQSVVHSDLNDSSPSTFEFNFISDMRASLPSSNVKTSATTHTSLMDPIEENEDGISLS